VWVCVCGWPNPGWRERCECCWREREQQEGSLEMAFIQEAPPPGLDAFSGDVLNSQVRKVIEAEQMLQVFQDIERREESDGTIPASPRTTLQRLRQPFAYTGGILLGSLLGVLTLLFNFLLFNWIMHMEF
jgi:hypothetical protein